MRRESCSHQLVLNPDVAPQVRAELSRRGLAANRDGFSSAERLAEPRPVATPEDESGKYV